MVRGQHNIRNSINESEHWEGWEPLSWMITQDGCTSVLRDDCSRESMHFSGRNSCLSCCMCYKVDVSPWFLSSWMEEFSKETQFSWILFNAAKWSKYSIKRLTCSVLTGGRVENNSFLQWASSVALSLSSNCSFEGWHTFFSFPEQSTVAEFGDERRICFYCLFYV